MKLTRTVAIGVDLIKISRFIGLLSKPARRDRVDGNIAGRLSSRILHASEISKFQTLWGTDLELAARYLAGCWATKEAVYKTLDPEDQTTFQFKNWAKTYNERGKPLVIVENYNKKEEFLISISHEKDLLMATVLRQEVHERNQ